EAKIKLTLGIDWRKVPEKFYCFVLGDLTFNAFRDGSPLEKKERITVILAKLSEEILKLDIFTSFFKGKISGLRRMSELNDSELIIRFQCHDNSGDSPRSFKSLTAPSILKIKDDLPFMDDLEYKRLKYLAYLKELLKRVNVVALIGKIDHNSNELVSFSFSSP
ncbi:hypothetical protein HMI54_007376, partial [Coelomomyces lativittatus]